MTVPTRRLGKNGPEVSEIGLGCMGMSAFYGPSDHEQNLATLNRAIELGCTFWDTSDIYGMGKNEELLSIVLKENRSKVFLATKFGISVKPSGDYGANGDPEYLKQCCENSLKRLGTDYIDLFYMHRMDPDTPIEKTMNAFKELVQQGKIKYVGLSECSAETLRRAHAVHPVAAVQIEYSPWTLDIESNGLLDAARELGVCIVAYSPLGRGFLTGQYKSIDDFAADDWRRTNPRFQGENFQKNLELVTQFEKLAEKKGVKPSQLVLAWVLSRGEDIIPIPGTRKVQYLEENLGASNVKLSKEDLNEIDSIIASLPAVGARYPEAMMNKVNL